MNDRNAQNRRDTGGLYYELRPESTIWTGTAALRAAAISAYAVRRAGRLWATATAAAEEISALALDHTGHHRRHRRAGLRWLWHHRCPGSRLLRQTDRANGGRGRILYRAQKSGLRESLHLLGYQ